MLAQRRLKPLRQGELDSLCGLYAILNAVRLSAAGAGRRLSWDEAADLFTSLICAAEDTAGATTVACCGIRTKVLRKLLTAAVAHVSDEVGLSIKVTRLVLPNERPSFRRFVQRIDQAAREPGSSIVLGVEGQLNHWTTVDAVSSRSLKLFDSDGHKRLRLARCRMKYEAPGSRKRDVVFSPAAAFRVAVIGGE